MRKPDEPRIIGLPIKSEVVFDPDVPVPEFKVMQELLRHSSPKTTLEIYTQAVTPAKHAAQAADPRVVVSGENRKADCRNLSQFMPCLPDGNRVEAQYQPFADGVMGGRYLYLHVSQRIAYSHRYEFVFS